MKLYFGSVGGIVAVVPPVFPKQDCPVIILKPFVPLLHPEIIVVVDVMGIVGARRLDTSCLCPPMRPTGAPLPPLTSGPPPVATGADVQAEAVGVNVYVAEELV